MLILSFICKLLLMTILITWIVRLQTFLPPHYPSTPFCCCCCCKLCSGFPTTYATARYAPVVIMIMMTVSTQWCATHSFFVPRKLSTYSYILKQPHHGANKALKWGLGLLYGHSAECACFASQGNALNGALKTNRPVRKGPTISNGQLA